MTARVDLLLEIGCEEIPARMLPAAGAEFERLTLDLLDRAGLAHGASRALWTPRRLAVHIAAVEACTAAREDTLLGPPAAAAWDASGKPTKAAEGFARKQGREAAELVRIESDKGAYAGLKVTAGGESIGKVLEPLPAAIAKIAFPKLMRWSEGTYRFVRPVHWFVALAGADVLPLSLFGVAAGRATRGHRAISPGPHEVATASDWEAVLERAGVIADAAKRRAHIGAAMDRMAAERGGTIVADEALLDECADLVEWPGAQVGAFDERFVRELPAEVLGSCLRTHQKGFCVRGAERLLPFFAVVVNRPDDPEGHVRRGHEWVVSGRLEDALFFWSNDRRARLSERAAKLEEIVFHRDLGSYAAKTRRVARLGAAIAAAAGLGEAAIAALTRAAGLSRCDLPTGLVGEFPELQGITGGLIARADGEEAAVTDAIYDLYLPAGPDDPLPRTQVGRLLGLADRLDTIVGGFAVGLVPSGSSDAFALRRAGGGALRLAAAEPAIDLVAAVEAAGAGYCGGDFGPALAAAAESTRAAVLAFLEERFALVAEREGARYDEIAAVRATIGAGPFLAADLLRRLAALREFRESGDFLALAAAAKRVRNILAQAAEKGEAVAAGEGEAALAAEAEVRLAAEVAAAEAEAENACAAGDYPRALARVAALRPAVDRFFDTVMVMDPDRALRTARLGLLGRIRHATHAVADLSELVVETTN